METKVYQFSNDVSCTCYIQGTGEGFGKPVKRPAVLILPGGAYTHLSEREADPIAFGYLKAGYQAFILRYSCHGQGGWPAPLNDYKKAIHLIHEHAEEWHIFENKTAVIGFSAGGHLAACGASLIEPHPNTLLLVYPVITSYGDYDKTAPDPCTLVTKNLCPVFLAASRNDKTVPVKNALNYLNALEENNVPFECHINAFARHGYSTGELWVQKHNDPICDRAKDWMDDSIRWMRDIFGKWEEER